MKLIFFFLQKSKTHKQLTDHIKKSIELLTIEKNLVKLKLTNVSFAGSLQRLFPVHSRYITIPTHKALASSKTWKVLPAF